MSNPLSFGPLYSARLVERPNRFILICESEELGRVRAFFPNPGRMWELVMPGAKVTLTSPPTGKVPRKTEWTAIAIERDGQPVFLDTHVTNHVARELLDRQAIPALRDARVQRAEVTVGNSRFDFLLEKEGKPYYLEVKSCTLFHNQVAMFPDAVTERGRRHLEELAHLAREGAGAGVLIVVHSPRVKWFMPDYHTDLAFSETFQRVREDLDILAISVKWTPGLRLSKQVREVAVPWDHVAREAVDTGSYLMVYTLNKPRTVEVGQLGRVTLPAGDHVYVGSAMKNLTARVNRHLRTRKRMHWHVDYLGAIADKREAIPIRGSQRRECEIAAAVSNLLTPGPKGFGCSDCPCATHLLHSPTPVLKNPAFVNLLLDLRMQPPQ
jgi:sugar fermentation stimulation protein A